MGIQVDLNGVEENKPEVTDRDVSINLKAVGEIKSFVATIVKDMTEVSAYVEKSRELIEHAKIHILLTEKQAARILNVTPNEMRQRRFYRREPGYFKVGDHAFYSFAVLIDYVARCEVRPIPEQERKTKSTKAGA
ncbi:MAG: hypothetical protein JNK42_02460 [Caedimonas sp.]|nr:hypothetical protein [Caedimonas sp.]